MRVHVWICDRCTYQCISDKPWSYYIYTLQHNCMNNRDPIINAKCDQIQITAVDWLENKCSTVNVNYTVMHVCNCYQMELWWHTYVQIHHELRTWFTLALFLHTVYICIYRMHNVHLKLLTAITEGSFILSLYWSFSFPSSVSFKVEKGLCFLP